VQRSHSQGNDLAAAADDNQRLRLLSNRYTDRDFEGQAVEVTIGSDGLTQITGFPTLGTLD
jgi:hypothetical protein